MVIAHATAKYIRTSSQKAGLVLDLIRGRDINHALATLQFSKKSVARDIAKVLRSAVANARQTDGFGGDVERLFVSGCHANQGPSQKRVRPAPMGRAFRVVKRTVHLTVEVTERAQVVTTVAAAGGERRPKRLQRAGRGATAVGAGSNPGTPSTELGAGQTATDDASSAANSESRTLRQGSGHAGQSEE